MAQYKILAIAAARVEVRPGTIVDAFEYGVEPRPPWFDEYSRASNYAIMEPLVGHYAVLIPGKKFVLVIHPELFEQEFEPIFN